MGRQENLLVSYVIVQEYNKVKGESVQPANLVTMIMQHTGVRSVTAREYIDSLKVGVHIKGKHYKIMLQNGGFVPWKESN